MTFDRRTATGCQQPEQAGFCELPAPAIEMKSRPKRIRLNFNELISHPESNRQHAEQVSEGHDDLRNEPGRPARMSCAPPIRSRPAKRPLLAARPFWSGISDIGQLLTVSSTALAVDFTSLPTPLTVLAQAASARAQMMTVTGARRDMNSVSLFGSFACEQREAVGVVPSQLSKTCRLQNFPVRCSTSKVARI